MTSLINIFWKKKLFNLDIILCKIIIIFQQSL